MHTGIFNGKRNPSGRDLEGNGFIQTFSKHHASYYFGLHYMVHTSLEPMQRICCSSNVTSSSRSLAILKQVKFDTVRSILNDCIEIQSEAIKFEPDVAVASSFGAAVALLGLLEQRFHIPLLCACSRVCPAFGSMISLFGT